MTKIPRLRIGLDLDGCIYPWTRAVNEALEDRYGITDLGEHTHWDYLQERITKAQWEWVWSRDAVDIVFGRLDLIYPGAREAVNKLAGTHEVHFVTHRHPRRTTDVTGRWLNYHFRNYAGVHLLHARCSKESLGWWDVFVDDKPETVETFLNETSTFVLMPVRRWNTGMRPHERLARFRNWNEVPRLIVEFFKPVTVEGS